MRNENHARRRPSIALMASLGLFGTALCVIALPAYPADTALLRIAVGLAVLGAVTWSTLPYAMREE